MMESSLACFKTHKRTQSVLQIVLFLVNEKCAIQGGGGRKRPGWSGMADVFGPNSGGNVVGGQWETREGT